MDYKEALAYLDSIGYFGSKPGLERIGALLEKLGNPHKGMKFVHIAGTNGKGSCAAMAASILKAAGYKTGLYTSPYLYRFNERMQVGGREIPDEALAEILTRLKPLAEAMEDHPTEFELMTAAALLWYKEEACDVVVLEVGLGGRFDATNIIDAPEAAVIMNIGLDHTAILGDTVEQIAFEKAGIIKKGTDAVLYQQSEAVTGVVRGRCEELGVPLHIADFSQIRQEFDSIYGQSFTYRGNPYALPLLGAHQLKNAATVLELAAVLRARGWKLEQSDVEHGLYAVSWPGRFEVVTAGPPAVIVDGGHNPQGAKVLAESLSDVFPDERIVFLMSVLADKDYRSMIRAVAPLGSAWVCVTSPNAPRALSGDDLARAVRDEVASDEVAVEVAPGFSDAMKRARQLAGPAGVVCAFGSLYSIAEIRKAL